MKVFLSWSGERSRKAADALRWWLPKVIQAAEPWVSTHDIDQGSGWFGEITSQLDEAHFGIFCLTADNLQFPWLLFEAGALWKGQTRARTCAYLLGVGKADVSGPLAQFQLTDASQEDTWKLVQSLNAALDKAGLSAENLTEVFEVWWPKLEERIKPILTNPIAKRPQRKDREILEEILQLVRRMASGPALDVSEGKATGSAVTPPTLLQVLEQLDDRSKLQFARWLIQGTDREAMLSWLTPLDSNMSMLDNFDQVTKWMVAQRRRHNATKKEHGPGATSASDITDQPHPPE